MREGFLRNTGIWRSRLVAESSKKRNPVITNDEIVTVFIGVLVRL